MLAENDLEHEVEESYIPLLHYITYLYKENQRKQAFKRKLIDQGLNRNNTFIIGICGPVSVGKSTVASFLKNNLSDITSQNKINLISTDDFLYSNAELNKKHLMDQKGFPQTYDNNKIINFLKEIKFGDAPVVHSIYSHEISDIVPNKRAIMKKPNVLIIEGINTLQVPSNGGSPISDYLDLSIYIDSSMDLVRQWYLDRFFNLIEVNKNNPDNFFYQWSKVSKLEAKKFAIDVWNKTNVPNIENFISPTKERADVVVHAGDHHVVTKIEIK